MPNDRLDDHTADRILSGQVRADDAPPGLAGVTRLLDAARAPEPSTGSDTEYAVVVAMRAAVLEGLASVPKGKGTSSMRTKLLSAKTVGTATAALLLAGGTAAAATGTLAGSTTPSGHVVTTSGTTPPAGNNSSPGDGHGDTSSAPGGTGPSPNADFGLCNAQSHNGGHPGQSRVFPLPSSVCANVTQPGQSSTSGTNDNSPTTGTNDETTEGSDEATEAPETPDSTSPNTSQPSGETHGTETDSEDAPAGGAGPTGSHTTDH